MADLHNNLFPTNKWRTRQMTLLAVGWGLTKISAKMRTGFAKKLDIGLG